MPKLNQTMTPREREIGARVNLIRKEVARWSQPELAKAMGLTQNQLAGVEYKRAPLRYGQAIFLCESFNVSQRWLALGVHPMQPRYKVEMHSYANYPQSALFSRVFDDLLDEPTARIEAEWIKEFGEKAFREGDFGEFDFPFLEPLADAYMHAASHNIRKVISLTFNWLPEDLQGQYNDALLAAHHAFKSKHAGKLGRLEPPAARKYLTAPPPAKENDLTNTQGIRTVSSKRSAC